MRPPSPPCRTRAALEALLGRTVYAERRRGAGAGAGRLCRWRSARRLAAQPLERLLAGEVDWTAGMSAGLGHARAAARARPRAA